MATNTAERLARRGVPACCRDSSHATARQDTRDVSHEFARASAGGRFRGIFGALKPRPTAAPYGRALPTLLSSSPGPLQGADSEAYSARSSRALQLRPTAAPYLPYFLVRPGLCRGPIPRHIRRAEAAPYSCALRPRPTYPTF